MLYVLFCILLFSLKKVSTSSPHGFHSLHGVWLCCNLFNQSYTDGHLNSFLFGSTTQKPRVESFILVTYISISIAQTPRSIIAGQRPCIFKYWVYNCVSTSAIPWVLGPSAMRNSPSPLGQQRPGGQYMWLLVTRPKHNLWSWTQETTPEWPPQTDLEGTGTQTSIELMNKQAMQCWDGDSMWFNSVTFQTYKLSI